MGKRVRITNESLNSYGTRVLTSGIDTAQFERNPVLLYMHERGKVIGFMKDLRHEGDALTGEPVFDKATELSERCSKQWEFGSLKMVSMGIDVLELSDDPQLAVEGQKSPTVTRCRLYEVSLVDIGSNDDALVLRRNGMQVTLGRDGENPLPLLAEPEAKEELQTPNQTLPQMDIKTLALQLGLPETADEAAVQAKITTLAKAEEENTTLKKEKEALELSRIEGIVDGAVKERRISADKKEQFVKLGSQIGAEELTATFAAMNPGVKLSAVINPESEGAPKELRTFSRLSEVPADEVRKLRAEKPEEYKRLYRAEYGMECEL